MELHVQIPVYADNHHVLDAHIIVLIKLVSVKVDGLENIVNYLLMYYLLKNVQEISIVKMVDHVLIIIVDANALQMNAMLEISVKEILFSLMLFKMIYFVIILGFNAKMVDNVKVKVDFSDHQ